MDTELVDMILSAADGYTSQAVVTVIVETKGKQESKQIRVMMGPENIGEGLEIYKPEGEIEQ